LASGEGGEYVLKAKIAGNGSPQAVSEAKARVNFKPFADAGADFSVDVLNPQSLTLRAHLTKMATSKALYGISETVSQLLVWLRYILILIQVLIR